MAKATPEYLRFDLETPRPPGARTDIWWVYDRHDGVLGSVRWSGRWRQYVIRVTSSTWSAGCMQAVIEFIEKRMAERKRQPAEPVSHSWCDYCDGDDGTGHQRSCRYYTTEGDLSVASQPERDSRDRWCNGGRSECSKPYVHAPHLVTASQPAEPVE